MQPQPGLLDAHVLQSREFAVAAPAEFRLVRYFTATSLIAFAIACREELPCAITERPRRPRR